jgi:polycystin 1L2
MMILTAVFSQNVLTISTMITINITLFKIDTCKINSHLTSFISHCTADLTVLNADSNDYGLGWNSNVSTSTSAASTNIKNAFKYTKALKISSYPLTGEYNNYLGGGYVYQMSSDPMQLLSDLAFLQTNNWIDGQTRAVLIELNIFNPNINMFAYCYLLFEIVPTGSVIMSYRFYPMTVFDERSSLFSFTTIAAVIYLVMVFMLLLKQIYNVKIHKLEYLKQFQSYLNLSLIAFSFTSFAIWLLRVWESQSIMTTLASNLQSTSSNNKMVNLQMLAYWDDTLASMLALCAALGTIKFLKLLEFNPSIKTLIRAFQFAFLEILGFVFIFALTICAWLQFGFVVFNDRVLDFSTFVKSMETGFLLILGKFQLSAMIEANIYWAIVFYVTFNIFIMFVMFNLFLTVICDSLDAAKEDEKLCEKLPIGEYLQGKIDYVLQPIRQFLEPSVKKKKQQNYEMSMNKSLKKVELYKGTIESFASRADEVVMKVETFCAVSEEVTK